MAAQLVAVGNETDEVIARKAGISRATLSRWKQHPEFLTEVDKQIEDLLEVARRHGVARLDKRLERRERDWKRLQQIQEERAQKYGKDDQVVGGGTGLIVPHKRGVGSGKNYTVVVDSIVDVALLQELRELEEQAAREVGALMPHSRLLAEAPAPCDYPGPAPGSSAYDLEGLRQLRRQGLEAAQRETAVAVDTRQDDTSLQPPDLPGRLRSTSTT